MQNKKDFEKQPYCKEIGKQPESKIITKILNKHYFHIIKINPKQKLINNKSILRLFKGRKKIIRDLENIIGKKLESQIIKKIICRF